MTKEIFDKLTKYEQIFRSAIYSRYLRAMDSRFAADMYEAMKELNIYYNMNCPNCMFIAVETLGKQYFDSKAKYFTPDESIPENLATAKQDKKEAPKPKKSSKKK